MASCERCHTTGIPFTQMRTTQNEGEQILVGPCCAGAGSVPALDYHFEVSAKNGIIAAVGYGGLKVEYVRTPGQLVRSFKQEQPEEKQVAVH